MYLLILYTYLVYTKSLYQCERHYVSLNVVYQHVFAQYSVAALTAEL